jgi:hypothetical protein
MPKLKPFDSKREAQRKADRAFYERNKERRKAYARELYHRNKQLKPKAEHKKRVKLSPEEAAVRRTATLKRFASKPENWAKSRMGSMKIRAKKHNIPFDKNYVTDLLSQLPATNCPCCGKVIDWSARKQHVMARNAPTVDRVVPALGYVAGNVKIICGRCNKLKMDNTLNDLERLVTYVKGHMLAATNG